MLSGGESLVWMVCLFEGMIFDLWIDVDHSRIHDVFDCQWTVLCSVGYLEFII